MNSSGEFPHFPPAEIRRQHHVRPAFLRRHKPRVHRFHRAAELFSASHSGGTLTTFAAHTAQGPERPSGTPAWLEDAGDRDITAHVDFTSLENAARGEGLATLGLLDQTYFLLGLAGAGAGHTGAIRLDTGDMKTRLALKTLLLPAGLGSSHKVLILGKGVGSPSLLGCSYRVRIT